MTTFFSYLKKHKVPSQRSLKPYLGIPFNWPGLILYVLMVATLVVTYIFIIDINNRTLISIPVRGGTISEGVIGAPRFINPVLASTETDVGLTKIIYTGLMKQTADGSYVPDLAQSYTVSPDGKIYTFILKDGIKWSDKKDILSEDVAFTITKLSNPELNQTTSFDWQNISVENPDSKTVMIISSSQNTNILEKMTVGILPKHIWQDIPDDVFELAPENLHPIGSGPFKYSSISSNGGVPDKISFKRNKYAIDKPYIDYLNVFFFANQNALLGALNNGSIDMTLSALPETAVLLKNAKYSVEKINTGSKIGLFRLPSEPLLSNNSFLQILDDSIDKEAIVATVENGYGINVPMHESQSTEETLSDLKTLGYSYIDGTLTKNGNPIGFSITTSNSPKILAAAQELAKDLGRFGMLVTIKAFDPGTFKDGVANSDYYIILANSKDVPSTYTKAITLYTKTYPFINSTQVLIPPTIQSLSQKYMYATDWYTRINKVWKPFTKN